MCDQLSYNRKLTQEFEENQNKLRTENRVSMALDYANKDIMRRMEEIQVPSSSHLSSLPDVDVEDILRLVIERERI